MRTSTDTSAARASIAAEITRACIFQQLKSHEATENKEIREISVAR
jgi:hypothetical protein